MSRPRWLPPNPELPHDTWVVAANNARAKVVSCTARFEEPELVRELEHSESRLHTSELLSDDEGRGAPRNRHASRVHRTAPSDPKETEAARFAGELCDYLRRALGEGRVGRIVVAASPGFLGRIRNAADGPLRNALAAEVPRDYSAERPDKLVARVRERLNLTSGGVEASER